jgi:nickel-type superoxide dismutase maturation protease
MLRAGLQVGTRLTAVTLVAPLVYQFMAGRLRAYAIEGASMNPALAAGDWVLVDLGATAAVGDIVVAARPDRPELEVLKRVAGRNPMGEFFLLGDNVERSTDSREWGWVGPAAIHGVVRFRYWPLSRLGRVERRES